MRSRIDPMFRWNIIGEAHPVEVSTGQAREFLDRLCGSKSSPFRAHGQYGMLISLAAKGVAETTWAKWQQ
jgi:hypothetical protein